MKRIVLFGQLSLILQIKSYLKNIFFFQIKIHKFPSLCSRFEMQRLYNIRKDLVGLVPSSWIYHLCHHSYHSFWCK